MVEQAVERVQPLAFKHRQALPIHSDFNRLITLIKGYSQLRINQLLSIYQGVHITYLIGCKLKLFLCSFLTILTYLFPFPTITFFLRAHFVTRSQTCLVCSLLFILTYPFFDYFNSSVVMCLYQMF